MKAIRLPLLRAAEIQVESLPIDISGPEVGVEILIREDGQALWVNVDERCVLRIGSIPPAMLVVHDYRQGGTE